MINILCLSVAANAVKKPAFAWTDFQKWRLIWALVQAKPLILLCHNIPEEVFFPSPIHLQLTSVSSTASWGETRTFPGSEQTPQPLLISLSVSLSSTCLSVFLIFTFLHPFSPFYFSATLEQRNENNCCRKCKLFGLLIIPTYAVWSVPVFFFFFSVYVISST